MYQNGELKGQVSEEKAEMIWKTIQSEAPALMNTLNSLKTTTFSELEFQEFKNKLDIYSKLLNLLCLKHIRDNVPYFDRELNSFLEKVKQKNKDKKSDNNYYYKHLDLSQEYGILESKSGRVVFSTPSISLFHILCKILFRASTNPDVFLFYLALKGQPNAEETVKTLWTFHMWYIARKIG